MIRRLFSVALALAVLFSASLAAACPVCAGREEPSSLRWLSLGALIVAPWFVAGAVAFYIRRAARAERRALHASLSFSTESFSTENPE